MSEQRYYVTETQLTNIADAIREKKGTTSKILIGDMPSEIRGIKKYDAYEFEFDLASDAGTSQVSLGTIGTTDPFYTLLKTLGSSNTPNVIMETYEVSDTTTESVHIVKGTRTGFVAKNPDSVGNWTYVRTITHLTRSDGTEIITDLSGCLSMQKPTAGLPLNVLARSNTSLNILCAAGHYKLTVRVYTL